MNIFVSFVVGHFGWVCVSPDNTWNALETTVNRDEF